MSDDKSPAAENARLSARIRELEAQVAEGVKWRNPEEYRIEDDLVQVLCEVTQPQTPDFPRSCEMPVSSGDHGVGERFVSIGHANDDGEWFVAGWEMTQDCWTDARCFIVLGFRPLPKTTATPHGT